MHVAEIHRYPVKSMLGERLEQAMLTELGIPGDRAWALKDEVRNGLTGAKRFPVLMDMAARFLEEPGPALRSPAVEMTAPDGASFRSSDADVNARLGTILDHPVSLWPLLPAEAEAHYRREPLPPGTDIETELRAIFGRAADEPLPDVSEFPAVLASHHSPPGTYFDAFPLLIMSRPGLAELTARARAAGNQSVFDVRRFRPNLLLDMDAEGFVEDAWVGRELRIGDARVKIELACPRCIMTTHGFQDLPRDPKVMRALVQHHGGELGVYASVVEPGTVATGAAVELC